MNKVSVGLNDGNARRVAVLAPAGRLDHQPGVINAVKCFTTAGYTVDVFSIRNIYHLEASFPAASVTIHYLPIKFCSVKEPRIWAMVLFTLWLPWVMRGHYDAVYAAGVRGLLAARVASLFRSQRLINLQLELSLPDKVTGSPGRLFKQIERHAIRSSWLSLIHDDQRAAMLCADAGIGREQIEIIPNAPCGPGIIKSSKFLHERLGLPSQTRILLSPGTVDPVFASEEIVVASQALPESWRCVIHSVVPISHEDPFIGRLRSLNIRGRVLFSLQPVPYEEIDEIFGSATIGLALYGSCGGANITEVGLASGKLCHFLKLGIPVIVSDYPVLREFVLRHKVGLPLAELTDLPKLVSIIEMDYEGYRKRSVECFDRELAFETHFGKVLDRLETLKS
jgi:glycosyltransferase involved in cell wall biosynthesis